MKRLVVILVGVLVTLTSCVTDSSSIAPTEWSYYDNEISEKVFLSFNNDTAFSYNCKCGTHISKDGKYKYDKNASTLHLSNKSNTVLYLDLNYLILKTENGVITYRSETNTPYDEYSDIASQYINNNNSPLLSILDYNEGTLTVAPCDYDADAIDNYKEYITKIDVTSDITFLSVSVTNDNGNKSIECFPLSQEDYVNVGEFHDVGYVNFDDNGKVLSVVFYGETIIED